VLTTIRAVTLGSRWTFRVHFEVLSGNEERYFDFQQGMKLGELIFKVENANLKWICVVFDSL
jgi:hypothetical protein